MASLDRKLFLWLASHSVAGVRVPRDDLTHLCKDLNLEVRKRSWLAGLRSVDQEFGESLEIDAVRRLLSVANIYVFR